jgi:hypothetical protein
MDKEQVEAESTSDQGTTSATDANPEQTADQAPAPSSKKKRGLIIGGVTVAATGVTVAGIALFRKFKKRK